jgi:hypothetical protein
MAERDCYLSVMENNGEPTLHPSHEEARASLDDVRRVEADLADRLVTPWWYHPGLGLVEALFISSMTFPVWLGLPAVAVGLIGLGLLVRNWQRLTGLGAVSRQYNVLAREWVIALLVVLLVAIVVVLLVDRPVVTAVTAVVVFVATVVLGRRGDSAVRDRLRHGIPAR